MIARPNPYPSKELEKLLNAIFGHDPAPPIGDRPHFLEKPKRLVIKYPQKAVSTASASETLTVKEMELLWNASKDADGHILYMTTFDGEDIRCNGKHFLVNENVRSVAEWRGALNKLEVRGLIEPLSDERAFFLLTDEGYQASDNLHEFAHWRTKSVTLRAHYFNAPTAEATFQCPNIWSLPTEYFKYSIRGERPTMRSVKEARSLLLEELGFSPVLNWQPTDIKFLDVDSGQTLQFQVEDMRLVRSRSVKLAIVGS